MKANRETDLGYAAEHDEAVEAVEHRDEVAAEAQAVHFQDHLEREQDDEHNIGRHFSSATTLFVKEQHKMLDEEKEETYLLTLKIVHPLGLLMVFAGEYERVEEDEHDDEPVEELRLDHGVYAPAQQVVLVLNDAPDVHEALAQLTSTELGAIAALVGRLAVGAHAAILLVELVVGATLLVIAVVRIDLRLTNPQHVVLVGLFDLTLLLELLQVAALLGLVALFGELTAQHTQHEVHHEVRADDDQADEKEVRSDTAFCIQYLHFQCTSFILAFVHHKEKENSRKLRKRDSLTR